jgi:hypothetical protein
MSDNRRQAYRYAVARKEATGLLRTSEGEVPVVIADASATGFGLICNKELVLHEGELAGLTSESGQSICRVMRVEYDDEGRTAIGLQRISEVAAEPETSGNAGLLARWLGKGIGSAAMLLAFGLGAGIAVGFFTTGSLPFKAAKHSSAARVELPREPEKRAAALARSFNSLDDLKSRQFIKTLELTDGQQRKIDTIFEKLVGDLSHFQVDHTKLSPETFSNMGLLMIRRAWVQVEGVLTPEQMAKWDAILDGRMTLPGDAQASL